MRERVVKALPVRSDYLPPFIEQLVLAIGIIVFHWSFTEMAFLYVSEIVVINILFPAIALFVAEPVETLDNDRLHGEPQTLQPFQWFPPIYSRNLRLVGKYSLFAFVFVIFIPLNWVVQTGIHSFLTVSTLGAIGGICVFQLIRAYREFVIDQLYQKRSAAEALRFGVMPLVELVLILLGVIAPVTAILAAGIFAIGIDGINSRAALWAYLLPIGITRVYVRGTDLGEYDAPITLEHSYGWFQERRPGTR